MQNLQETHDTIGSPQVRQEHQFCVTKSTRPLSIKLHLKAPKWKRLSGKILYSVFKKFKESCQDHGIESEKTLAQLKEKWKKPLQEVQKIKDNNKATGRGHKTFEFFEELDSFWDLATRSAQSLCAKWNINITSYSGKFQFWWRRWKRRQC